MSNKSFFLNPEFENLVTDKASLRDDMLNHLKRLKSVTESITDVHTRLLTVDRYELMIDMFNFFEIENLLAKVCLEMRNDSLYYCCLFDDPYESDALGKIVSKNSDSYESTYDKEFVKNEILPFFEKNSVKFVDCFIANDLKDNFLSSYEWITENKEAIEIFEHYFACQKFKDKQNKSKDSVVNRCMFNGRSGAMWVWDSDENSQDEIEHLKSLRTIENLINVKVSNDDECRALLGTEIIQDGFLELLQDIVYIFVRRYFFMVDISTLTSALRIATDSQKHK